MFEIAIMIICACTLIILKFSFDINFKRIKKMKIPTTEELETISKKFPNDQKMCEDILSKLENNSNTKIKTNKDYNSCLYTVYNNTITIGKFQQEYMKPQTIAHECIHSCQNKRTLWANFIFSNIYLIYFIVVLILTFFNKLPNTNVHTLILIFLSIIQYIIRFSLENEAMLKAKFIAKEYIEENKILNKDEENKLLKEYDKVNNIGIPFMNYYLITMNIIKIMFYALICLI